MSKGEKTRGIFITGTGTGVGKTVVAAGIAAALRVRDISVGVMKPVHTGCMLDNERLVPEDSLFLARAAGSKDSEELITPFMFKEPAAPYAAAREHNIVIDINKIADCFNELCRRHDYVIVEGIGGVLVPVTKDFFVADLIKLLNIPVILVTRPDLGSINHTMLSIHCLKTKKINLSGIVISNCRAGSGNFAEKTFQDTIETLSDIPVIGTLPYITDLNMLICSDAMKSPDLFLKIADTLFDI
ncbi:MAG: dethiobiotin synthase [Nitrospirae bacterium]|nr:dethiobiotin synthase [Nitrospirota bacterium]